MKKLWLILFLILLCVVVAQSASYLDSRSDFYTALRVKLGVTTASSGYLNDTTCAMLYKEAVTAILPINKGIRRVTTIRTTWKQDTYALDTTLVGIDEVRWVKLDSTKSLQYLPISEWSKQAHNTTDGKENYLKRPSFYDYTDSLIVLYPVPTNNAADTLEVWGWHRLGTTDTATVTTSIPERYRLAVLYHMAWNWSKARQDARAGEFKEELAWALSNIGLKLGENGVAPKQ